MLKALNSEHSGIGGLYFISTMVICSFIMFLSVRLSWDSQAIAMADNLAYITCINVAVDGYIDSAVVPYGVYNGGLPFTSHPYSPLADYNQMMVDAGLTTNSNACTECRVSFDGMRAVVQYEEFRTSLGTYVRPHQQESTIERD